MPSELVASNVVLTAQLLNPTIFSQLWLVRHGIVGTDDFKQGCLFADEVSKVEAKDFSLLIVPPQLQFAPHIATEEEAELVILKIGAIVRALPETPYRGIGLNFHWHVWPQDGDGRSLSRELFFVRGRPLSDALTQPTRHSARTLAKMHSAPACDSILSR